MLKTGLIYHLVLELLLILNFSLGCFIQPSFLHFDHLIADLYFPVDYLHYLADYHHCCCSFHSTVIGLADYFTVECRMVAVSQTPLLNQLPSQKLKARFGLKFRLCFQKLFKDFVQASLLPLLRDFLKI